MAAAANSAKAGRTATEVRTFDPTDYHVDFTRPLQA
jgi:hypothetical protein